MNITEDYCSYEVAKLLKEKGFDKFNTYGWDEQLFDKDHPRNFSIGFDNKEHWISCPSQSMAMKWLRGTHEIFIEIKRDNQWYEGYEVTPITKHDKERGHKPEYYAIILNKIGISKTTDHLDSYEEAVEAALKYCLENLI